MSDAHLPNDDPTDDYEADEYGEADGTDEADVAESEGEAERDVEYDPAKFRSVELQSTHRSVLFTIALSIRRYWKRYTLISFVCVIVLAHTHFWLKHPGEDRARAEVDAATLVVALTRHHRRTGHDPEAWESLVPSELPSVPVDPFDGRSVRMRRGPTGSSSTSSAPTGTTTAGVDVQTWVSPGRRSTAPDGDWILWPAEPGRLAPGG